jgi:hypothetical protein
MSWINSIFNAISEVEMNSPEAVNKVASLSHDCGEWNESDWSDYNKAAGALVEPFSFPDGESDEDEFFYEKSEREGSDFIKGVIGDLDNSEEWGKIIDLLNEIGY